MRSLFFSLCLLLLPCLTLAQAGLQPIPALSARVIDTTGTLDATQRQALEDKLSAFEKANGSQIVVLLLPTTQPEDIVAYTQRVGDSWKIGRKDIGDGLLLVVAKNDRTVRIATSKTLEGAIPDLTARQVIDRAITPRFREGDFSGGLNAGIDQISAFISAEKLPAPVGTKGAGDPGSQGLNFVFLFFIAVPFAARVFSAIMGRKFGAVLTGSAIGVLTWLMTASLVLGVLAGMAGIVFALASVLASGARSAGWGSGISGFGSGRYSGGSGGLGGNGFSSGGGGNFGGGGASGKW